MHRPQAPAAGALKPEDGPEKAGRIEAVDRRVKDDQDYSECQKKQSGRRPSDARAPESEDVGPPPTPARTV